MDAMIREVLAQSRSIAEDVQARTGVQLRTATVASVAPLRIRYDGEPTASVVSPRTVVDVRVGDRVLVVKSRGQATIVGILGGPHPPEPPAETTRWIAGAIRKTGGVWAPIADAGHDPWGIQSVVDEGTGLRVHYGFEAKQVLALTATADETYTEQGFTFGASVGLSSAVIRAHRSVPGGVGGYVTYSGTSWSAATGNITSVSALSGGRVQINHAAVHPPDELYLGITGRGSGRYLYRSGGATATSMIVEIYNLDGTPVSAFASDMRFFVTRDHRDTGPIPPADLPEGSTNIWIFGLMKV